MVVYWIGNVNIFFLLFFCIFFASAAPQRPTCSFMPTLLAPHKEWHVPAGWRDAGFEPGTAGFTVWCTTNEPLHPQMLIFVRVLPWPRVPRPARSWRGRSRASGAAQLYTQTCSMPSFANFKVLKFKVSLAKNSLMIRFWKEVFI